MCSRGEAASENLLEVCVRGRAATEKELVVLEGKRIGERDARGVAEGYLRDGKRIHQEDLQNGILEELLEQLRVEGYETQCGVGRA